MRGWRERGFLPMAAAATMLWTLLAGLPAANAVVVDALVSVASPTNNHPQNAVNEPSLAVDPTQPTVLAAGANDLVDMQPCSRQASTTAGACSFPLGTFNLGVGLSGVYFSFNSGHSWVQPTYHGLTAADCDPSVEPCTPHPGPIHTVPNYYENGLRSRSDTGVAFGPVRKNGSFSWANGSRLYFSTLATNLTDTRISQGGQNTPIAITVSHIDDITPARVADQSNWSRPYFVPAHVSSSAGLDKEQIWADNAASSPFFGNVYLCYSDFHSFSGGNAFPLKPMVAVSPDGGITWKTHEVAPPIASATQGSFDGCTVRTDSHGGVYAFFTHFGGTSLAGFHTMIKSNDGGQTWRPPVDVVPINDICFRTDPVTGRCVEDGYSGARADLAAMPSVDIANGAPTGADATNQIVDAWVDGKFGLNHEVAMLSYSTNLGRTWSTPTPVSEPGDRPAYTAPAISPNGQQLYVVYQSFGAPFQDTTGAPRPENGVFRMATLGAGGTPGGWTTVYTGPFGDARGSSQGRILYNEFLGDYVYAVATRTYGAGVWDDVRNTADCPAMDSWRQASIDAGHRVSPAPWPLADCPANFGNNDIFSATTG
ncbi:MAG TPA: sialidase family protein [Actinomycetota bacterium]|nr:sialidase family protein [Actinomycetota bacterium]